LAVRAEYLRILNYKTKKLAAALEIVTKSHEPEMEPTDQMQVSFIDEEEEHDVDPGQQANQVQDDYALYEELTNAWMNRKKQKENQYKTDLELKANQLREKDDELREKDTQLNNKDVELKDIQNKLLSVTEELDKMKDCVRRTYESNEKERRRRLYYEWKLRCITALSQETPDNYSTELFKLVWDVIVNYKRNQQAASPSSTSGQSRLKRQRTAGETSSASSSGASSSGASSSASSKTCQR
jgi:hypothetical protein